MPIRAHVHDGEAHFASIAKGDRWSDYKLLRGVFRVTLDGPLEQPSIAAGNQASVRWMESDAGVEPVGRVTTCLNVVRSHKRVPQS